FRGRFAPNRIGNTIPHRKPRNRGIVVNGYSIGDTQRPRFRQLPSADARNHVHAEFLGSVHGGPPDASQRPGHEKRLATLRPSRQPHELITRQRYKRYGWGIAKAPPVRERGESG